MRVAIVHHWFVTRGGGERVAECLAGLFPTAELFTLLQDARGLPEGLKGRTVQSSSLQSIPLAAKYHRYLMPLYRSAVEGLDLRGFDLVISSDSGPVKGVRVDPGAVHICYCHSPMRYLYDGYESYRRQMGAVTRAIFSAAAGGLRRWDVAAAQKVTYFVANSRYVAERIRRVYGRESTVIYPPIDLARARRAEAGKHYLCAGRLVGYKRTELMVQACLGLGRTLRVAGAGPEFERLRRLAGPGVTMLGELSTEHLWDEYASCRALLFAADEDFGMVPLEAQACGRPVVAYGAGGSLETVRGETVRGERVGGGTVEGVGPGRTGVFFGAQTVESVMGGMLEFERLEAQGGFDPEVIHGWAEQFRTEVFLERMRELVLAVMPGAEAAMRARDQARPGESAVSVDV